METIEGVSKTLTVKDLFIRLVEMGFAYFKPKSSTWKSALVKRNEEGDVLCILLRKKGIDFKFFRKGEQGVFIDSHRNVRFEGGETYRNFYYKSEGTLTFKSLVAARYFVLCKEEFYPVIQEELGMRFKDCPEYTRHKKRVEKKITENFSKKREMWQRIQEEKDWKSIVDYIEEDCGGYVGDGMWLDDMNW